MIPDEAVEAAARKQRALAGYDWDNMNVHPNVWAILKPTLLAEAREILEAAAPHMQALWAAEGCDGSDGCASPDHIEGCFSTNPDYRSQV